MFVTVAITPRSDAEQYCDLPHLDDALLSLPDPKINGSKLAPEASERPIPFVLFREKRKLRAHCPKGSDRPARGNFRWIRICHRCLAEYCNELERNVVRIADPSLRVSLARLGLFAVEASGLDELGFGTCSGEREGNKCNWLNPAVYRFDIAEEGAGPQSLGSVLQKCEVEATLETPQEFGIRYKLFDRLTSQLYLREDRSSTPKHRSLIERIIWGTQQLQHKSDHYSVDAFLNLDALQGTFVVRGYGEPGSGVSLQLSWRPPHWLPESAVGVTKLWCDRVQMALESANRELPRAEDILRDTDNDQGIGNQVEGIPISAGGQEFDDLISKSSLAGRIFVESIATGQETDSVITGPAWSNYAVDGKITESDTRQFLSDMVRKYILRSEILIELPPYRTRLDEHSKFKDESQRRKENYNRRFQGKWCSLFDSPRMGGWRVLNELATQLVVSEGLENAKDYFATQPMTVSLPFTDEWIQKWFESLFRSSLDTRIVFDAEIDGPFYLGVSTLGEPVGVAASDRKAFAERKWGVIRF